MLRNKQLAERKSKSEKVRMRRTTSIFSLVLLFFSFTTACRYDMQDQPRYKVYKKSDFFSDGRSSRENPDGTIARGNLREDKALYTGKKETSAAPTAVATVIDPSGNTVAASFPNDIEEFPIPVTKELIDRGQSRYNIYCVVCHGPTGSADGMIVRRGFPKPPTYHDDRLRNAPVGHFFDVATNGWGKMNGYAAQISVADRWAIVAYIRALQISQNLEGAKNANSAAVSSTPAATMNSNTDGGKSR